ncbi:MAG: hypothetical protein E7411_09015 [Ruminococcaceae bacterium]|nr:hypothetical protein [Oscillospiraceae bacterium]
MGKYNFYTTNELKPRGWLKRQLEIQAEGLSGNLDKVWRDIKDSSWIGGDAEGWERVPYWLDGFIPLAYQLENEDMIKRAKKYIDAIIENQKKDGWICPCDEETRPTYDNWAVQLITKVLTVYYECSGDERIPEVIYKTLKNYYDLLKNGTITLFRWGQFRWFETFIALNFLKEKYNEEWIYDLTKILKEQGADYESFTELWKRPLNKWTFETHIVNLTMMLKYEAVSCDLLNVPYEDKAEKLISVLKEYNGNSFDSFNGDECLSGLSPIHGTELCAIVEQMYSYELLYAYTKDPKWAERLEVLAFNALPATVSDDMWAHQYDQLSNQVNCIKFPGKPIFTTNHEDAHLFGLEPNFGCCTANFNQGFPKFALSAFVYDDTSVISSVPVPSKLKTDDFEIELITEYPFENTFTYEIKSAKAFKFKVRIPSFAKNIKLDGKIIDKKDFITVDVKENSEITLNISYEAEPYFTDRPYDLKTVRCGSLIFALPVKYDKEIIEYEAKGVERKFPYCDYHYIGKTPWNYAYTSDSLKIEKKEVNEVPFSSENPALVIKTKGVKINWGLEEYYEHVCAKVPMERVPLGEEEEITLYPYGNAKLRMTEMPKIK